MLKTTLLAAAALVAFGATGADADTRHGHDRGEYQRSYEHGHNDRRARGHHGHERHGWRYRHRYGPGLLKHRVRPHCRYVSRKVPVRLWNRRGASYRNWAWRDVRVCV